MSKFEEAVSVKNAKKVEKSKLAGKIFFVVCIIAGCILGLFSGIGDINISNVQFSVDKIVTVAYNLCVMLGMITAFVGPAVVVIIYVKTSKLVNQAEDSDNVFDKADKAVDRLLLVETALFLLDTLFLMISMKYLMSDVVDHNIFIGIIFMLMGASIFFYIIFIQKTYKLNNKLTPNIAYEITDLMPFTTAEIQTDEAQKLIMYKSAYKTLGICTNTLISVGGILMLLSVMLDFSILYGVAIFISGAFVQIVFSIKSYQLSHKK